jgi:hypothetical protein
MMQALLVQDLTEEKFANMYSQTLVYGLFVARYSDLTPDNSQQDIATIIVNPTLLKDKIHLDDE